MQSRHQSAAAIDTSAPDASGARYAPAVRTGRLSRRSAFSALGERDFAWFFTGNFAFFMAMQMQFVLRGFLAYELTGRVSALGAIAVAISLPMAAAAPFGGVVADRINKRLLLIVTQSCAAIASLIIAVLILAGLIEFWHLIAVSVVTGVVFSFNMPARQAMVPLLVPQQKLMNAVSLQMGGQNLTRIIAPAVGGLLIGPLGTGNVYVLTFALFALATASEFRLPKHGMGRSAAPRPFREELTIGFRFIWRDRTMRLLVLSNLLLPLFGFPVQQMLPVFAKAVFHQRAGGLGVLFAVTGIGGLAGAMLAANMDGYANKGRLMLIGSLVMGVFLIGFALTPFALALPLIAIASAGQMLFMTTNNAAVQSFAPDAIRGRVMSVLLMSFGLMPLGVVPVTVAAEHIGARHTVAIASALLVGVVVVLFSLSRTLRNLRFRELAAAELSPVQAARLVAEGKLTQELADQMMGRTRPAEAPVAGRQARI